MHVSNELGSLEITVQVSDREDGGVRVLSEDVPGLMLGGSDRQRIWNLVGPAVQYLLGVNKGLDVVRVSGPMTAPPAGDVAMHVEHLTVEYRRAA